MTQSIYNKFKQSTLFEKLLLLIGMLIVIVGFWLINKAFVNEPVINWASISALFLWFLLIFLVILTDSSESIKEELAPIIKEHINETKLLKEEVILLRKIADQVLN